MKKIVLISCVSMKQEVKRKAKDLYISPLFKYNLRYAQSMNPDKIFILSAKYGLVDLEEEIEPYDKTLNKMGIQERKEWAKNVLNQLNNKVDLQNDEITFLAGKNYREFLVSDIKSYKIPLEGLSIGRQLQYLKEHLENE